MITLVAFLTISQTMVSQPMANQTLAGLKARFEPVVHASIWTQERDRPKPDPKLGSFSVKYAVGQALVGHYGEEKPTPALWAEFPTNSPLTAKQVLDYLTPQTVSAYQISLWETRKWNGLWLIRLKVVFSGGVIGRVLVRTDQPEQKLEKFDWLSAPVWSIQLTGPFDPANSPFSRSVISSLSQKLAWEDKIKLNGEDVRINHVFLMCAPWR
ncbi:MAG: hypothetical protein AAB774_00875 [Patescibacteria group bacterium]